MANLSKVLYDNALKKAGVTIAYNGTDYSGFEYTNAIDYKDFSLFQLEPSQNRNLEFTMAADTDINKWGLFAKYTGGAGNFIVRIYYEQTVGMADYVLLDSMTNADGALRLEGFSGVTVLSGAKIRIRFEVGSGTFYIRQIMVGEVMDMERGQYVGVNPPTLSQGIVQSNNLSENGSILGSNIKRIDVKSKISLKYCTETWVRDDWDPFAIHASKGRGFFYQWNPTEYSGEVVYCVASKVSDPKNMSPTPLMSVDMDLICRQPDPT